MGFPAILVSFSRVSQNVKLGEGQFSDFVHLDLGCRRFVRSFWHYKRRNKCPRAAFRDLFSLRKIVDRARPGRIKMVDESNKKAQKETKTNQQGIEWELKRREFSSSVLYF